MSEPLYAYACEKGAHHLCSVIDCRCCANGHGLNNLGTPVPYRIPVEVTAPPAGSNDWYGKTEIRVDDCTCGHHISNHPRGLGVCRRTPGECDCTGYRWNGLGPTERPVAGQHTTDDTREKD